jgi:L-threonylcarbamoyladenylate synthase
LNKLNLQLACVHLSEGNIIAYPTEAVWGLGCDPDNQSAVTKLLELKNRSVEKGLILVAAHHSQISDLLKPLSKQQKESMLATWPGPVTWIIPDLKNLFPYWIKGNNKSVAIRVSSHPIVQELCSQFGKPLVSTSANVAGEREIRSSLMIQKQFGSNIDYVVEGKLGDEPGPSQIRDLLSQEIIR